MEGCFSVLFWLCFLLGLFGLATLITGIMIQMLYFNAAGFLETNFLEAPVFLIIIGGMIFVIAFLGYCGATKRNYCLLMTFGFLMLCMFVLGVAGGVASYYKKVDLEVILENNFNKTMHMYNTNEEMRKSWDIMQHELKCCGSKGPEDWKDIGVEKLPISCCPALPFNNELQTFTCDEGHAYTNGCLRKLVNDIKAQANVLVIIAGSVALLQILIVIFTCFLAGMVRSEYQTV